MFIKQAFGLSRPAALTRRSAPTISRAVNCMECREPKKFASMINRLVSFLGHLKLSDITVSHLQQFRRKRLSTKTNRGTYTDVATVNRELSTCRAMLNDAVVNDWLVRSPFVKAKKGELIVVAHSGGRFDLRNTAHPKSNVPSEDWYGIP